MQRLGRKTRLSHLRSLSFSVCVCVCTVFVKLKKPLSPGNRSCATQMVPSLFKWEAEPLSAVVLPVSCTDLNLGSSLPSSASLSHSTHTHMQTNSKVLLVWSANFTRKRTF